MITSRMIASLIATITAFTLLEVRMPKHSRPVISSTITAAIRLWWSPKIHAGGLACHGAEVRTTCRY